METRPRTYCRRNHSHQPHPRPIAQKKLALHLSNQISIPKILQKQTSKTSNNQPFHCILLQVQIEPDPRCRPHRLKQEEVEKKHYLNVNGLWAWNWRFSSEGILESLSDNKFNLLVGCYPLEKSSLGTYTSGVDLFGSGEEGDAMLRVHVASKKTSVSQVNRVYFNHFDSTA